MAALNAPQRARLHCHFTELALSGEHSQEFRDYVKLWRRIISAEEIDELVVSIRATRGAGAVDWLVTRLRRPAGS
jgi:hypothetical protein